MSAADKNIRRVDEAERARHIAAGEATAFATMLLGLLNGAEAAQHHGAHKPEPPATEPAPLPPHPIEPASLPLPAHPTEAAPTEPALADHRPGHDDQHVGAIEAPAADSPPTIQADAATTTQTHDASATTDAAPAAEAPATHVLAPAPPVSSFSPPTDHAHATGDSASPDGSTAPSSFDLGASIHQLADTVTGLVDTSLATVSQTIASLSTTVGQLTSSLSDTISHLADGLTGTLTNLTHDMPGAGMLEPLVTDILGPTQQATDVSDTTPHGASLLDTAGAIPTTLLHPLQLHLGFLGQPTIDGHETHDGAFSALGFHHF